MTYKVVIDHVRDVEKGSQKAAHRLKNLGQWANNISFHIRIKDKHLETISKWDWCERENR